MGNEYTLKIDVDTAELQRKLQGVFGKLNVGGGQGGKGGGIMSKLGSTSGTASFVKIAGIIGVAGGIAGMGKLIIDSSPMMKSMFKLLNVGLMFILRPIGDAIGLIFRPLMIQFVRKIAIPFYKSWVPLIPIFNAMGTSLAEFFANPAEFIESGKFDEAVDGLLNFLGGNGQQESYRDYVEGEGKSVMDKIFADLMTIGGNIGKFFEFHIKEALGHITIPLMRLGKELVTAVSSGWTAFVGLMVGIGQTVNNLLSGAWIGLVGWFVDIAKNIPSLEDIWSSIVGAFEGFWKMLQGLPIIGGLFGSGDKQGSQGGFGMGMNDDTGFDSDKESQMDAAGDQTVGIFDKLLEIGTEIGVKFGIIKNKDVTSMSTDMARMGELFGFMSTDTESAEKSIANITNLWSAAMRRLKNALSSVAKMRDSDGNPTPMARRANRAKKSLAKGPEMISAVSGARQFAMGGIIPEHVIGVGQSSGKSYEFGERGAETVSPGVNGVSGGGGGSGGNNFNITINGAGNAGDIEREMRPIILRILKESNSRRGIL